MLVVNPSVTKQQLYKQYSQEFIMSYFLSKIAGKEVILNREMNNPMRVDKHHSSGVYYANKTLMFRDFTGYFKGDCIAVAAYYFGYSKTGVIESKLYYDLLKKIYYELSNKEISNIKIKTDYVKKNIESVEKSTIKISFKIRFKDGKVHWLNVDREYWGKVFTSNFLINSNVFPVEKVWIGYGDNPMELRYLSSEKYPVYVYLFDNGNSVKVLAPYHGKKDKWRNNSNYSVIEGYDLLKESTTKIWCTSYKDSLCFNAHTELQGYNYLGEYVIPNSYKDNPLLANTKYVFIDNDITGRRIGLQIKKKFPELIILCIPKCFKVKDPFEFISKYGIEYSKRCLIRIIERL